MIEGLQIVRIIAFGANKHIQLVLARANTSLYTRAKMAACIVHKGEVISCECNSLKTHPVQAKYSDRPQRIHLHAEIATLVRARWPKEELGKDCHMFIGRVWKDGQEASSRPCNGCWAAIAHAGIESVTYYWDNSWRTQML